MNEDWRYVVGNDLYLISDHGQVMNARTGHILTAHENSGGTLQVGLHKGKKIVSEGVHNLVARAYLDGVPENAKRVKHKNGNKKDNRPDNLHWEP